MNFYLDKKCYEVSGIYCITNNINNHKYIGQAKNIYTRLRYHISASFNPAAKDYGCPIHIAIRKYGIINFKFDILELCGEQDNLNEQEIYWIKYYHTYKEDPEWSGGYNLTAGGKQSIRIIKLHLSDVKEIWQLLCDSQMAIKDIAAKYNVTADFINRINTGQNWHNDNIIYPIRNILVADELIAKYKFSGTCICQIDLKTKDIIAKFTSVSMASVILFNNIDNNVHINNTLNNKRKSAYGYGWVKQEISKNDWLILLDANLAILKNKK